MECSFDNHHTQTLEIELTTKCTLGCPACPRHTEGPELKEYWDHGHIDTDLAKRVADETNYNRYAFVGCYGDPIYHPDFLEICDYYLNEKQKSIMVHTNGSAKPKKFWDQAAAMDWSRAIFVFSVDGLSDTNHIYRINSKWDQIEYAMKAMASIPYNQAPELVWKFIKFPYNQHQIKQASELAYSMGFNKFEVIDSWRLPGRYRTPDRDLYVFKN